MSELEEMSIDEVVTRIITLNDGIRNFWAKADNWAPIEAAQLLSKSQLDWQVSLSRCLKIWPKEFPPSEESGRLILAWANLGSLVEGTMKLFLSVWYKDYKNDVEAIDTKKGKWKVVSKTQLMDNLLLTQTIIRTNHEFDTTKLKKPDVLGFEELRQFFRKRIWYTKDDGRDEKWDVWIQHIQHRRNVIHAYKSKDIGTFDEFFIDVRRYLKFLRYINSWLPYPDDIYMPREA